MKKGYKNANAGASGNGNGDEMGMEMGMMSMEIGWSVGGEREWEAMEHSSTEVIVQYDTGLDGVGLLWLSPSSPSLRVGFHGNRRH